MPGNTWQLQSVVLAATAVFSSFLFAADNALAQNVLAAPESVLKAYLKVPTSQWQNRLPFVSDAERARPLMEKWYSDRKQSPVGYEVSSVTGPIAPELYPAVGDSHEVFADVTEADGSTVKCGMIVVRTPRGFQIDWLKSFKPQLLEEGLWEEGRLARDTRCPEIKSKHLETVGERYVGKQVKMLTVRFAGLNSIWLTQIPGVMVSSNGLVTQYNKKAVEAWVGFFINDRNGELCQFVFAPKDAWADKLLEMEKGQLLNLVGVVTEMERSSDHGLLVYDVEILKP